jgi:hypothetical protein
MQVKVLDEGALRAAECIHSRGAFFFVVPGQPGPASGRPGCELGPGLHVFARARQTKTWMAGTILGSSPKTWPGHDGSRAANSPRFFQ